MTEEEQLEYDRCSSDPVYFINKYIYYYKYSPNLADFKLYPFQENLINTLCTEDKVLINTSRQMGITTTLMLYALHSITFNSDYSVIHLNVSAIRGIAALDKLKDTYNRLPDFLKVPSTVNNRRELLLTNGSKFKIITGVSGLVGTRCDLFIVDNAAFIPDLKEVYECALPTIAAYTGKIVSASTVYKKGWFLEQCAMAEQESSTFKYIKLPYYLHPKRGRLWRLDKEYYMGHKEATVECDCTHYYSEDMHIKPILEYEI